MMMMAKSSASLMDLKLPWQPHVLRDRPARIEQRRDVLGRVLRQPAPDLCHPQLALRENLCRLQEALHRGGDMVQWADLEILVLRRQRIAPPSESLAHAPLRAKIQVRLLGRTLAVVTRQV